MAHLLGRVFGEILLDDVIIFAAAVPPIYERRLEPNNVFNDVTEWPPAAANGASRPEPDPPEPSAGAGASNTVRLPGQVAATAPTPGKRGGTPPRVVQGKHVGHRYGT